MRTKPFMQASHNLQTENNCQRGENNLLQKNSADLIQLFPQQNVWLGPAASTIILPRWFEGCVFFDSYQLQLNLKSPLDFQQAYLINQPWFASHPIVYQPINFSSRTEFIVNLTAASFICSVGETRLRLSIGLLNVLEATDRRLYSLQKALHLLPLLNSSNQGQYAASDVEARSSLKKTDHILCCLIRLSVNLHREQKPTKD
jgi:hypothetical protein